MNAQTHYIRDGDLAIRRMRDTPDDYALVAKWLTDSEVLAYYDGRDNPSPLERVMEDFGPMARGEDATVPGIIEYLGAPIGYIQYYPTEADEAAAYGLTDYSGHFGMDVVIGETAYWNQGLGTRIITAMLRYLFEDVGAQRVVIDPQTWNTRAVRVWEKCGFQRIKLLPAYELHEGAYRDCWLMAADPPGE